MTGFLLSQLSAFFPWDRSFTELGRRLAAIKPQPASGFLFPQQHWGCRHTCGWLYSAFSNEFWEFELRSSDFDSKCCYWAISLALFDYFCRGIQCWVEYHLFFLWMRDYFLILIMQPCYRHMQPWPAYYMDSVDSSSVLVLPWGSRDISSNFPPNFFRVLWVVTILSLSRGLVLVLVHPSSNLI